MARQYLKKKILLAGKGDNKIFKRTFTIVKKISEGSSVICYEAYHNASGKGVLKEFYPEDAYSLERNKDGQLIHSDGFTAAKERFKLLEKEYIAPYELMLRVKNEKDNGELSTFIPTFEIYHGCDDDGEISGTTYIWTPDPKLETFDTICKDIHRYPKKNPEHKLVTVLTAIESLTKCICALHKSELIHRDIKPSNFGFIKRANETLTQTISMFDINSICSVYDESAEVIGTQGFLEPEAGYLPISNKTDIYAIGATLFSAIIVNDEMKKKGYIYNDSMYNNISKCVDESKLIVASENNAHPRLRNILTRILKKSLAKRNERYENCEEMIEDIEKALYYALPSDIAQKKVSGEQWILKDIETSLDKKYEKNSNAVIQYHLYKNPLYKYIDIEDKEINVMLVGFGNYGQKFMDVCLQLGQMPFKTVNVKILTDDITDKEIYLHERPSLNEFFSIDKEMSDSTNYGNISFEVGRLDRNLNKDNYETLNDIIEKYHVAHPTSYFFVALGDDELNRITAHNINNILSKLNQKAVVSYVQESEKQTKKITGNMIPVFVGEDIAKNQLHSEIERMAFNVHLVWEKTLNIDFFKAKKNFRKSYNYYSCVMNVLFMKYKLYALGIDLDECSSSKAAQKFLELRIMQDKNQRELRDSLIYVEHKRWVVEKLCLGWQKLDEISSCKIASTKDEKSKRHVCLVKSRPDQLLSQKFFVNNSYDKWDIATDEEIEQLDALDKVSLNLHRLYCEQARKVRKDNIINGYVISSIKSLVESDKKCFVAFQEWYACVRDLWSGDESKIRIYDILKNSLISSVNASEHENKNTLVEQIKIFDTLFYPIIASVKHTDYKQFDLAYIENIPFILTYSEDISLVIPFNDGGNTELFSNLAISTLVNPLKITYICYIERKQDVQSIKDDLPYLFGFMKKKNLRAMVDFLFVCNNKNVMCINMDDVIDIKCIEKNKVKKVKVIGFDCIPEISDKIVEYLNMQKRNNRLVALEKNDSKLSYLLLGAGLYNDLPFYEYNYDSMTFSIAQGCNELTYIKKYPHISVSDMMSISLSSGESSNQPEFYNDYRKLWTKYHEKTSIWKSLCSLLKNHSDNNDIIVRIKGKKEEGEEKEVRYVLPYACLESVEKIIKCLIENGFVGNESRINIATASSIEVTIKDKIENKPQYDKLFGDVYKLMDKDSLNLYYNIKCNEVIVSFDNLMISQLELSTNKREELYQLLIFFSDNGYLINLTRTQNLVSFTYSTRRIKDLLTSEGKILEVYTYHKVKELGKFDDVVSGYEIDWENTEVKNEFDCIITKGFKTIFVECKARLDIEQDFYYKLSSLTEQFGINATAVLVADTEERNPNEHAHKNNIQRKRGNMMNVITVWKKEHINNIGHTLLKIINGTFISEE